MLFRKKMPKSCAYCSKGTQINDDTILCVRRGIVPANKRCCRFSYDPCKRFPKKQKASDFSEYSNVDYSL